MRSCADLRFAIEKLMVFTKSGLHVECIQRKRVLPAQHVMKGTNFTITPTLNPAATFANVSKVIFDIPVVSNIETRDW